MVFFGVGEAAEGWGVTVTPHATRQKQKVEEEKEEKSEGGGGNETRACRL